MKENGFTLVEVIISLAIVSIALVTLLSAFNRSIAAAAGNTEMTEAVMIAGEKMTAAQDEVLSGKREEGDQTSWRTDVRFPRYDFKSSTSTTPFDNVSLVTVKVRHDGKEAFTLNSYVVKR